MSLINDALKKAQNRQGETTPPPSGSAGPGPAAIPSAPRKGRAPAEKTILIGAGVAIVSAAISAVVIFFVLRKDDKPSPTPTVAASSPITAPVLSPATTPISPAVTQPASSLPPAPAIAVTPTGPQPAASSPDSSPITPAQPAGPGPSPVTFSPVSEPAPTIKLGTRIQAFVDRLRVTSIRISETGNKAILNDRLFRINDLVEPSLGLRLTDIQPNLLTFTDDTGATYLRHF